MLPKEIAMAPGMSIWVGIQITTEKEAQGWKVCLASGHHHEGLYAAVEKAGHILYPRFPRGFKFYLIKLQYIHSNIPVIHCYI